VPEGPSIPGRTDVQVVKGFKTNAKTPVLQQVSKYQTEGQPHKNVSAGSVKTWTSPRLSCHGRSESAGDASTSLPLKDVLIIQHLHDEQCDGPRKQTNDVKRTQDFQKRNV
jgi:hypothetical protein